MTSWSRAAPEKAGWYYTRIGEMNSGVRYFTPNALHGGLWTSVGSDIDWTTAELRADGVEFGPRVPSPSEIERAAEALEIAEAWAPSELSVPESARKGMEFSKERIRAALEGLRKGQ